MTIEEFEKKAKLVDTIRNIDKILVAIDAEYNSLHRFCGIGTIGYCGGYTHECVKDEVLTRRFTELLKQRKQELLKEFEK